MHSVSQQNNQSFAQHGSEHSHRTGIPILPNHYFDQLKIDRRLVEAGPANGVLADEYGLTGEVVRL